jgi:predicted lipoprotein with Yx(FWY)xxD motif
MRQMMRGLVVILAGWTCIAAVVAAGQRAASEALPMPSGIQSSTLPDGTSILTDAKGMTLYTFLKDTPQESNCNGACAVQWPPVAATGAPPGDAWTVITRMDGANQWAYRGRPLYGWIKDARPGDITGEGVANGAWKIAAVGAPPDLVKVHLSHVSTAFHAAPSQHGLLATALAEARIAVQHAGLMAKAGDNLAAMKMHAGHVLHAIDPKLEPMGPGLGFGARRAAEGITEQVQLAARVPNASGNVLTLASHVVASSNNTVRRLDEIAAVARRIQTATTAADAAPEAARLNALARQLSDGLDVNKDGQIGWQTGEGGLQQVETQMQLLLRGEGISTGAQR